mmetsp:Transcript_2939/g.9098  ORF Transcript_2939/g.9098 Transcript_2939/m.9098 type:complete len:221 (+) Transcript_2939:970-1632(+)
MAAAVLAAVAAAALAAPGPMAQTSRTQPGRSAAAMARALPLSTPSHIASASCGGGPLAQTSAGLSSRGSCSASARDRAGPSKRRSPTSTSRPQRLARYPRSSSANCPSALPHWPSCPGCFRMVTYALTLASRPEFQVSRITSRRTPAGRLSTILPNLPCSSLWISRCASSLWKRGLALTSSPSQLALAPPPYICSMASRWPCKDSPPNAIPCSWNPPSRP